MAMAVGDLASAGKGQFSETCDTEKVDPDTFNKTCVFSSRKASKSDLVCISGHATASFCCLPGDSSLIPHDASQK